MSTRFKLPCPHCSAEHHVSIPQAGESIACQCGQTLLVPALRELRQLERVEDAEPRRAGDWDVRRGVLFVGGALLVTIGVLATWRIWPQRRALDTAPPAFREIEIDVQDLPLLEAWKAWKHFREQKLDYRATPQFLENRTRFRQLSRYLYAAWAVAGIGVLLIVGSLIWRPRQSKGRRSR